METLDRERCGADVLSALLEGSSLSRDQFLGHGIEFLARTKKSGVALPVKALGSPLSRSHA